MVDRLIPEHAHVHDDLGASEAGDAESAGSIRNGTSAALILHGDLRSNDRTRAGLRNDASGNDAFLLGASRTRYGDERGGEHDRTRAGERRAPAGTSWVRRNGS